MHDQDASDTKNAFTHAGNMLKELKTTQLSPRNYYELYMKVNPLESESVGVELVGALSPAHGTTVVVNRGPNSSRRCLDGAYSS